MDYNLKNALCGDSMIEIILIIGVIFVLALVGLIHLGYYIGSTIMKDQLDFSFDSSTNHLFIVVETILALVLVYLFKNIS